jgi:hypothetical protein
MGISTEARAATCQLRTGVRAREETLGRDVGEQDCNERRSEEKKKKKRKKKEKKRERQEEKKRREFINTKATFFSFKNKINKKKK